MPLPGGPSDKAGNRYEAMWTVACMARVALGEYDSIRLEPPGPEGRGVEFWLRHGDMREDHQVKRRGARRGHWTLRELYNAGVLQAFGSRLAESNVICVFVSMQGADELRELTERARDAADRTEFEREFAKGEWGRHLSTLVTFWSECTSEEVFSRLKRIRIRILDEEALLEKAKLQLASIVEGDASGASDILFAYAFASVHQELDRNQILGHLKSRGFDRPVWADPQTLVDAVAAANERYLTVLERELIRGDLIQRDEGTRVLAAVQADAAKRGAILTGGGGSGKSTVLLQVIKSLQQQGTPVLAFRVDRLEPTPLPDKAGQQMGLHGSPVATLAALAKGRPCVLVVDQLDAVSLVSGRNPAFFECFEEMVRQALTQPAMRLVIACRRFDFENDHRLRKLGGRDHVFEKVEVRPLSTDIVQKTVKAMGINAGGLSDRQIQLLSVPAHLKLLDEVADEGATVALGFDTANDLYDLYWNRKQVLLKHRLGKPVAWVTVIDTLCEHMNEHQILSAPEVLLDAHTLDVQAMASEHVLVLDDKRIAFFHEGFFDYAFARRFAARGGDLIELLRSGEQHLFRRTLVRQILLHERAIGDRRYVENLRTLLSSEDIRFHIKQVVFALLAQFADPTEEEWRVLETLSRDSGYQHRREIWSTVQALPWFRLLDSLGVIAAWLEHGEPDTVDQAVMLLGRVQRDASDRVAELVEPYVGVSEEWRNRHRYLIQRADLGAGRRFFELLLRLIDNGVLDGIGMSREDDFLSLLYELAKRRADWTCEAVGHYLRRHLKLALDADETNPFREEGGLRYSHSSDLVLIGSAQQAPGAFVEHVLPIVLRIAELNLVHEGEAPWQDTVWRWRYRPGGHGVDVHLLHAAEEALRKLAREAPEEFNRVAAPMKQTAHETVQFLLLRAFGAGGKNLANNAIEFICASNRRMSSGFLDASFSNGSLREVIEAVTPFCSNAQLANLEAMLLDYYSGRERSPKYRGSAQFELLTAIIETRRSALVKARIGQWQRKFGMDAPRKQLPSGVSCVGSPISTSSAERMSDEQWLKAITRYAHDRENKWRGGKPMGGALELGQTLEEQVKKEPTRFARLVLQLSDNAHRSYFDAVLRGLEAGAADVVALFDACRRCHRLPKRVAGSSLCRLVEKLAELPWPEDLLDAVAWYATEDPDPADELWKTKLSSGKCGDIDMAGVNCVRGAAAGAVRALLFADIERLRRFLPTLRRMVRDPSIAVRSCVVTALFPVLNRDRELAMGLFLELCDTEDVLLTTRHMEEFMCYTTATHFEQLRPVVERMLRSGDPEVAQAGARRACVASLDLEDWSDLAERCLAGPESLRKGATQVLAECIGLARYRSVCEARLIRLFDDPSEEVKAIAAECFDYLKEDALGNVTSFIEGFLESAAFLENHEHLIRALERTTARLPDVTIAVCERFIKIVGAAAGDMRTRAAGDANRLSDLIIRAYHQAANRAVKTRCLDTIDALLRVGTSGLHRALNDFDR